VLRNAPESTLQSVFSVFTLLTLAVNCSNLAQLGKKKHTKKTPQEYLDRPKSTSRSLRWKPGRKKTPMDDAKAWNLPFASAMKNSDTEKQE